MADAANRLVPLNARLDELFARTVEINGPTGRTEADGYHVQPSRQARFHPERVLIRNCGRP